MSSNPTGPFKTTRVLLADGKPLFNEQEIYAAHKGYTLSGNVAHIDISGKEAGQFPTVRAVLHDVLSHTVNAGIKPNPNVMQVGSGLRHISDPNPRGVRFCRMYQYDDNGNRTIAQDEIDFLLAWYAQHGATGGTGDPSQIGVGDPSKIPWKPWVPGEGKPGGTGATPPVTPPDVPIPIWDKPEGGDITGAPDDRTEYHDADLNRDGFIDRDEKKAWNKKNPDNPVDKGKV